MKRSNKRAAVPNGLKTGRDAWNYRSSRVQLEASVARMVAHFDAQVARYVERGTAMPPAEVVDLDPTSFKWSDKDFQRVRRGETLGEFTAQIASSVYRPFHRRQAVVSPELNNRMGETLRAFPTPSVSNLAIGCTGMGDSAAFSPFAVRSLPDESLHGAGNHARWFPRYVYGVEESGANGRVSLFDSLSDPKDSGRRHNVTDHALDLYRELDPVIDKDDVFFYVYGILHSNDYRTAFASDLKKSLPRIPQVESAEQFWAFSNAGRELAQLHTEYESVEPWLELTHTFADQFDAEHPDAYRVLKMKHAKVADPVDPKGRKVDDRSRIIYNDWITIGNIPERAYEYELGSRSAIAWVMESNRVRTDKASGIVNDPNDWATEHDDPTYILDLVGQVVTVSMRTLDIVGGLPALDL